MKSRDDAHDVAPSPCPACGRPATWRGNRVRPFCSLRCKLVDLGAWIEERYRVPGPPLARDRGEPGGAADLDGQG